MKLEKAVIEEWKRFVESDEFQHNPECGSLLLAQHFAEWGRTYPRKPETTLQ